MKKLIILFALAMAINSCSDDDNVTNATALEGNWHLTYFLGGSDPTTEDPIPNPDVSGQNIRYIFRGDQYTITQETEINSEGNFVLENFENGKFKLFLKDNSLEYTTDYIINFSKDNNTVFFEDSTDRFLKLERIQ